MVHIDDDILHNASEDDQPAYRHWGYEQVHWGNGMFSLEFRKAFESIRNIIWMKPLVTWVSQYLHNEKFLILVNEFILMASKAQVGYHSDPWCDQECPVKIRLLQVEFKFLL